MTDAEREMRTKDFYSGCFLKAMGYPLLRLDRQAQDYYIFVFDDPNSTAEELLIQYWDGRVQVDAKTLIDAIRDMKAMLHHRA